MKGTTANTILLYCGVLTACSLCFNLVSTAKLARHGTSANHQGAGRVRHDDKGLPQDNGTDKMINIAAEITSTPKELYYHKTWAALPLKVRVAYATLGYDELTWNKEGAVPIDRMCWGELSQNQQDAASFIGYTQELWDAAQTTSELASSLATQATPKELYYHKAWAALPSKVLDAYRALGFDELSWNKGFVVSTDGLGWTELSREQQDAASFIGYTQDLWDVSVTVKPTFNEKVLSSDFAASDSSPRDSYSLADEGVRAAELQLRMASGKPAYSILPRKIYSVIGLESSGTQYVSKLLEVALRTGPYREGSRPCRETCNIDSEYSIPCKTMRKVSEEHPCDEGGGGVQVQHFSLPWGGSCQLNPNPPVVDVVLPQQCTREQTDPSEIRECNEVADELLGQELGGKRAEYPIRYQLNITSHKMWYDSHGVEQVFVIMVRDDAISFAARRSHCSDPTLRREEEEVGKGLIVDAIDAFVLKDGEPSVDGRQARLLAAAERKLGSALPSGGNVVVASYESLVQLRGTYVKMLYSALGINLNYVPNDIANANVKYLNKTTT